jgi:dihydrolipoamide dehydrogenase
MAEASYDLVVIGSGPGGYTSAIRAAQLGLKTACVEKYPTLGGTCLNVGCIPSKALLDSSEHFAHARHGFAAHGIKARVELDLPTMLARKDKVVKELTSGVGFLFKKNKVEPVSGTARIVGSGKVEVTGAGATRTLETQRILIATGSKPAALPGIAYDDRRIVHSTHALTLPEVPKRMLVVGAGAIGLELGSVWLRLGAEVEVLEFMDRIVPGMDRKSGLLLQRSLERQGMKFRLKTSAKTARVEGDHVVVMIQKAEPKVEASEETCDVLLVAVGRRPYTEGLGAAEVGVKLDERGRIVVDEHYRTNVEGIFAIGDVIQGPMLAHKAEEEGIAAVERMAGLPGHVEYRCIPNVVYTWPELASVGMSEEEAAEAGVEVAIGSFPFWPTRAPRPWGARGQVKVIADASRPDPRRAHLRARASDPDRRVATMELNASAEDVARSVHAHPTLPEAVREAALAVAKRAINI